ncbi:MAG: hypothetical protein E6767_04825 [Dysgonomonas sp.]|nr:hypothetical protein [Dysgonomonas sp.]
MRYLSPIRFYTYCGIDIENDSSIDLSRLKKIVSAEFAMATDGTISIDNFSYNKNDILLDLESPDWNKNLSFHILIWQTKSLLNYLETDTINTFKSRKEWINLSENKDFVNFTSPYFATSYNNVMKYFLNPVDFDEARFWLLFLPFINDSDREEAMSSTCSFLEESIRLFKNTNTQSYWTDFLQIQPWSQKQWHLFINDLPDTLFHYKEPLANALINLTVEIQSTDVGIAYMISTRLTQLKGLSANLQNIIQKNHEVFSHNHSVSINAHDNSSSDGGSNYGCNIIVAIIVIIKIILLLTRLAS